jgi:hypothetical protein
VASALKNITISCCSILNRRMTSELSELVSDVLLYELVTESSEIREVFLTVYPKGSGGLFR